MSSKQIGKVFLVLAVAMLPVSFHTSAQQEEAIDVAICLDTSKSMENLIETARLKLWEIVNELAVLEPTPRLRVALLTYGNSQNDAAQGWVRVETPLTEDLDLVSQRLFSLEVDGGNEYVASVLKTAVSELEWSDARDSARLIFLAGNEDADQDKRVDFRAVASDLRNQGMVLQVIFCGQEQNPKAATWRELAEFASGGFATIDHRMAATSLQTPFDRELASLGASLSETLLPMGEEGLAGRKTSLAQDENAASLGDAAVATRALTKASALYTRQWDLLNAIESGRVNLYEMDESQLPEPLRDMTDAEREAYLFDLQAKREEITQRIRELGAQRRQFVSEQVKGDGLKDSRTFDGVVRRAIRDQLEGMGFQERNP